MWLCLSRADVTVGTLEGLVSACCPPPVLGGVYFGVLCAVPCASWAVGRSQRALVVSCG